ncbi:DUF4328 domain-containing protein [Streptomyces sp. NPDC051014]|uniref:DUF4328 domain-containing protein n=1 Tax=Streptomyces sp. NPDC051014 TaxID=3155751 RepID=UPI0033FBEE08
MPCPRGTAVICARCRHFAAAPGTTLCDRCRAAPPAPVGVPAAGGAPGPRPRSPVGLGWAAAVLLGAVVAADLFALAADLVQYDALGDLTKDGAGAEAFRRADSAGRLVGLAAEGRSVTMVACVVVYLCWFHRVRANAEVFDPAAQSMARGWAVAGWFVPVVSLWFPRRITLDIWHAGAPRGTPRPHLLVNAWWTMWLLTLLVGRLAKAAYDDAEDAALVHAATGEMMVRDVVDIVAAVLAILVVMRLTRMQHERAFAAAVPAAR